MASASDASNCLELAQQRMLAMVEVEKPRVLRETRGQIDEER